MNQEHPHSFLSVPFRCGPLMYEYLRGRYGTYSTSVPNLWWKKTGKYSLLWQSVGQVWQVWIEDEVEQIMFVLRWS